MSHTLPALHNAMWPGLVGKGDEEGQEPPISLERMLDLTAAAQVDGQKFDGIDYFLFLPHTNPAASDDEFKAIFQPCPNTISVSIQHIGDLFIPLINDSYVVSSYEWFLDGTLIGNGAFFTPLSSGEYQLLVEINGCQFQSAIFDYDANGINHLHINEILISPNPASEYIIVKKPQDVSLSLSITDIHGRETHISNYHLDDIDNRFDISNLSRGMYEVILESDNGQFSYQRFIKD